MKKAYVSGNYIIFDIDGDIRPYPRAESYYDQNPNSFTIKNKSTGGSILIPFDEAEDWYNEAGDTTFDLSKLTTMLRDNTEIINFSEAGATAPKTATDTFSALSTSETITDEDINEGDTIIVMPIGNTVNEFIFVSDVINNSFTVNRVIIDPLGVLTNNLPFRWIRYRY